MQRYIISLQADKQTPYKDAFEVGRRETYKVIQQSIPGHRDVARLSSWTNQGLFKWEVECDETTLAALVLRGAKFVKNLTKEQEEKLEKARISGYYKLTPLEREALGIKEHT